MDFEKERKSHYFKVSKVFHGETVEKNENPSRVVHKYQYHVRDSVEFCSKIVTSRDYAPLAQILTVNI